MARPPDRRKRTLSIALKTALLFIVAFAALGLSSSFSLPDFFVRAAESSLCGTRIPATPRGHVHSNSEKLDTEILRAFGLTSNKQVEAARWEERDANCVEAVLDLLCPAVYSDSTVQLDQRSRWKLR